MNEEEGRRECMLGFPENYQIALMPLFLYFSTLNPFKLIVKLSYTPTYIFSLTIELFMPMSSFFS